MTTIQNNVFESVTKEFTISGTTVKVHGFSTGKVAVKTKFRETKRKGALAILAILFDSQFTDWLPIWVWVIEHPEGIFVIDSGENSNINDSKYFDKSGFFTKWFNRSLFKFQVTREQEIDIQLQKLGINIKDVKSLVLTHMHIDHTDGLKHFQDTKIIVSKIEKETPSGQIPQLFPTWFDPQTITLDEKYECFDHAYFLTQDKDMIALHTPGHTPGSMSILLKTDQCDLLFVGDVCYEESQIRNMRFSGANESLNKAKKTYENILELAQTHNLVILPSHDEASAQRLLNY